MVTALCSEGSMFRRSYIQKVLCQEGYMFRRFYVHNILRSEIFVQKVLCLESTVDYLSVPIGHTDVFTTLNLRRFDVEKRLCAPQKIYIYF